jgi:hypothetical protein
MSRRTHGSSSSILTPERLGSRREAGTLEFLISPGSASSIARSPVLRPISASACLMSSGSSVWASCRALRLTVSGALGMTVVAEGVETANEMNLLTELGQLLARETVALGR